jgi:hypothetical protein
VRVLKLTISTIKELRVTTAILWATKNSTAERKLKIRSREQQPTAEDRILMIRRKKKPSSVGPASNARSRDIRRSSARPRREVPRILLRSRARGEDAMSLVPTTREVKVMR